MDKPFVKATGRYERPQYGQKQKVGKCLEDQVKKYDSNNDIIACADERRDIYIAKYSEEAIELLQKKGYTHGSMWVPFSNEGWGYEKVIARTYKL